MEALMPDDTAGSETHETQAPLRPIPRPFAPLALPVPDETADATAPPTEAGPGVQPATQPPTSPGPTPVPGSFPFPHFCFIYLRPGCYRITYRPNASLNVYHGTMRVDVHGGTTTISGDLYRFFLFPWPPPVPNPGPVLDPPPNPGAAAPAGAASAALRAVEAGVRAETAAPFPLPFAYNIPIYARSRYYSYLRVIGIQRPPIFTTEPCRLVLTAQEYVYTQPPAGSFNGTFPAAPGTRTVTIELEHKPPPIGFPSVYFEGVLKENGAVRGSFTMGWVSSSFRRAHVEVDTLLGSVAPQAVTGPAGMEDFRSVFATAGWDLTVTYDQVDVPVPAGVNPNTCWSSADLHALMLSIRNPATNLDTAWRLHLVVVPATMGCGRGVMYDQIDVPPRGRCQLLRRRLPGRRVRHLRHGLRSAAAQRPARLPAQRLARAGPRLQPDPPGAGGRRRQLDHDHHPERVRGARRRQQRAARGLSRRHLPGVQRACPAPSGPLPGPGRAAGGMTFGSGHSSTVPETDRRYFAPNELSLELQVADDHIELGEPLSLRWQLTNRINLEVPAPTDISLPAQHTFVTVTDPRGRERFMPSFVIRCDDARIAPMAPGEQRDASELVFWSSNGFAFETPGRHEVDVRVVWAVGGVPFGVRATVPVWVNYPQSDADNEAASILLDPQVGMYVALGGGADHLTEAVDRLNRLASPGADRPEPKALRGLQGILPAQGSKGRRTTRRRGRSR
jgi:hypothetical protein